MQVVILGQDPYHGAGQAMGMAFSVALGVPVPPSLRNIFAELQVCARVREYIYMCVCVIVMCTFL